MCNCSKNPCTCLAACDRCFSSPVGKAASSGSYTVSSLAGYVYADIKFANFLFEYANESRVIKPTLYGFFALTLFCFLVSNGRTYLNFEKKPQESKNIQSSDDSVTQQKESELPLVTPKASEPSFWRKSVDGGAALGKAASVYCGSAMLLLTLTGSPEIALLVPLLLLIPNIRSQWNLFQNDQKPANPDRAAPQP